MMQFVEENEGKLPSVFPLITTLIPGHSRIDTFNQFKYFKLQKLIKRCSFRQGCKISPF